MKDKSIFLRHLLKSRLALGSIGVMVLLSVLALFAPLIAPHDPYDLTAFSLTDRLLPPVFMENGILSFPLGTDDQGRCIFSTICYGLRTSFLVGFGSIIASMSVGMAFGLISGYYGRWLDAIIGRLMDTILSFPAFLVAVLLLGLLKQQGVIVLIIAISICHWVRYARVMRGQVLGIREQEYVDAAKTLGASTPRIILHHVMPNAISPLFIIAAVDLGLIIVQESTLSFLGIGVPLTMPSLGMMISSGYTFLFAGVWWPVLFPGAVLALLILSVNIIGDWLRTELNPRN